MFQVIHKALEANNNQYAEPRAPQSFAMQNPSPNEGRFELKSSQEPGSQFPPSSTFVKSLWMPPASCTHTSASLHSDFPSSRSPFPPAPRLCQLSRHGSGTVVPLYPNTGCPAEQPLSPRSPQSLTEGNSFHTNSRGEASN